MDKKKIQEILAVLEEDGEIEEEIIIQGGKTTIEAITKDVERNIATGEASRITYTLYGYGNLFGGREFIKTSMNSLKTILNY